MKKILIYTKAEITPILEEARRDPFISLNDFKAVMESDIVLAEYNDQYFCIMKDKERIPDHSRNCLHKNSISRYLAGEHVKLYSYIEVNPHCEEDDFEDVLGDVLHNLEKDERPVINATSRMEIND